MNKPDNLRTKLIYIFDQLEYNEVSMLSPGQAIEEIEKLFQAQRQKDKSKVIESIENLLEATNPINEDCQWNNALRSVREILDDIYEDK